MCGRAVLTAPRDVIREWFDLEQLPEDLPPRFNIAPSQLVAVIRTRRRLELLRWGLLRAERSPQINMRIESIARSADRQKRCLVVVDGFYEWKREGSTSQPFLFREASGHPFALGGIWQSSTTADGEVVESVAILTCPSLPPVEAIHDRMPLVIPKGGYERWLQANANVSDLLVAGDSALVASPVSSHVNSPANDDPRCIEPAEVAQGSLF